MQDIAIAALLEIATMAGKVPEVSPDTSFGNGDDQFYDGWDKGYQTGKNEAANIAIGTLKILQVPPYN